MKFWLVFGMLRIGAVKPCSMGLPSLLPFASPHVQHMCHGVAVFASSPIALPCALKGPHEPGLSHSPTFQLPWMVLALHAEEERFALEGIHGLQWLYMLKSHLHSGSGATTPV